tara:strand:+ start:2048 stop:2695 length:648 start_codon:yes stop_codon:yes gene_type:complete
MKQIFIFLVLIFSSSCKQENQSEKEKLENAEIIFYEDGRVSAYISGDDFENSEANKLNSEGVNLAKEGYFEKAKLKFQNGLEIEPENPSLLNNLGNAEHELKNYQIAIKYFEESFKVSDSLYLNAGLNLGLLYWKDYEFEKSVKVLEYVLSKSSKKYEKSAAHFQLAITYLDMNTCEKAKWNFIKAKADWKQISGFDERLQKLDEDIKNCVQHNL